MNQPAVERVVSGGQTGVDRAALDVALALGIACGGWCPKGRLAEDGTIHARYPLRETSSPLYPQRTEWNVRDSDATLILYRQRLQGGSALTQQLAQRLGRPVMAVDLQQTPSAGAIRDWLRERQVRVLNVAGPRASDSPELYESARTLLLATLGNQEGRP